MNFHMKTPASFSMYWNIIENTEFDYALTKPKQWARGFGGLFLTPKKNKLYFLVESEDLWQVLFVTINYCYKL